MTELTSIDGASQAPIPKCPPGFKAAGRRLWKAIHAAYDFEDAPEKLVILEHACRTADLVERLQKAVDETDDLRVRGSQGQPVAMPEVGELRMYRALLTSLLKAVNCPEDEADQLTRSELGKLGAKARWGSRG
jgi:hypothetical protein